MLKVNVLEQASEIARKHWPKNKKWKAFLIVAGIVAAILGIAVFLLWCLASFVKAITAGGLRNKDLYIPKMRW